MAKFSLVKIVLEMAHLASQLVSGNSGGRSDRAGAAEFAAESAPGAAAGDVHTVVGHPERLRDRPLHVVRALRR